MRERYSAAVRQDPDSQLPEEDQGMELFTSLEDLLGEAQFQWDDGEWLRVLAVFSQVRKQLTAISTLAQGELDHAAAERLARKIDQDEAQAEAQSLEEFRAEEYWAERQMGEHEPDQDRELGNTEEPL